MARFTRHIMTDQIYPLSVHHSERLKSNVIYTMRAGKLFQRVGGGWLPVKPTKG